MFDKGNSKIVFIFSGLQPRCFICLQGYFACGGFFGMLLNADSYRYKTVICMSNKFINFSFLYIYFMMAYKLSLLYVWEILLYSSRAGFPLQWEVLFSSNFLLVFMELAGFVFLLVC